VNLVRLAAGRRDVKLLGVDDGVGPADQVGDVRGKAPHGHRLFMGLVGHILGRNLRQAAPGDLHLMIELRLEGLANAQGLVSSKQVILAASRDDSALRPFARFSGTDVRD
jgi:hypothetical protein